MHSHDKIIILCRADHGLQLCVCELRVIPTLGERENATRDGELDHITAVLIALTHSFVSIIGAVDHPLLRTGIAA